MKTLLIIVLARIPLAAIGAQVVAAICMSRPWTVCGIKKQAECDHSEIVTVKFR
jgi:hypothetical protein